MRRLAKATSAFNFGRSDSAAGRDAVAFATRGASIDVDGTGASTTSLLHPSLYRSSYSFRRARWLVAALAFAWSLSFAMSSVSRAAPVPGDPCPNGDVRQQQGVAYLPACMALEQVSPVAKGNASATAPTISSDGERVRYFSYGAFEDPPSSTSLSNQFVATRGTSGWTTASAGPPKQYVAGSLGSGQPFAFTPDFSRWSFAGMTTTTSYAGVVQVFLNGLGGVVAPLSPLLAPLSGGTRIFDFQGASRDLSVVVFSPNKNQVGTDKNTSFIPGDPQPAPGNIAATFNNAYIARLDALGAPTVELLARDLNGKAWGGNCGAAVGGVATGAGGTRHTVGAMSENPAGGYRIWLSARSAQPATGNCSAANRLRILERTETPAGPEISESIVSECDRIAPVCATTPAADDHFEAASLDGTKVFLRTARQLTDTDTDTPGSCAITVGSAFSSPGCDLYLYDSGAPAGERLTQVSAGDDPEAPGFGNGADVLGVTAISGDGSHVYFVAKGVLTPSAGPEGTEGTSAVAGQPNLYLYQRDDDHPDGRIAFIGILDSANCSENGVQNFDCAMLWGAYAGRPAQAFPILGGGPEETDIGGDGHVFVFASRAPLTADDEDGTAADLFRYDADSHELARVSKAAPTCTAPVCGPNPGNDPAYGVGRVFNNSGFATGPAYAQGEHAGRLASEDGETIAFATQERLVSYDDDGATNLYLWRQGELYRLPAPVNRSGGANPGSLSTVSPDGTQVAYASFAPILPGDGDTAGDIYVLRAGGGFLASPPVPGCDPHDAGEKGCLVPSVDAPVGPVAGTSIFAGRGNLEVKRKPMKPCGKRKVRRGNRCVAKRTLANRACAKRKGKAKRRCVVSQVQRLNRAANTNRRASK